MSIREFYRTQDDTSLSALARCGVAMVIVALCLLVDVALAAAVPAGTFGDVSGDNHHPVSTTNPAAQAAFDEGMLYRYAFNSWDAIKAFRRAAMLDPSLAMAHWGIALALGADINTSPTAERDAEALAETSKAAALGSHASPVERAYIAALALRYEKSPSNPTSAGRDYSNAMRRIAFAHPADPDATALYAESLMDLQADGLFFAHGRPLGPYPQTIITLLQDVLARFPRHIGAHHLFIHAVDQSDTPQRALPSADFLAAQTYPPGASHLAHMAVHIYYRVGRYGDAIRYSMLATGLDDLCASRDHPPSEYSSLWYHKHNLRYLLAAEMMAGSFDSALAVATKLDDGIDQIHVLLRFERWEDILNLPIRPDQPGILARQVHFGRALALAALGKTVETEREATAFAKVDQLAADGDPANRGIARIEAALVAAAVARVHRNFAEERTQLEAAVATQDGLVEEDVPLFFMPVRETLGQALLRDGHKAEARAVFKTDLQHNPNNPRSLAGLVEATDR